MIESRLDRGRGPVATVLVQKGTLRQGDIVVAGAEWGRVRAMLDDKARAVTEAGPSAPVEILGLAGVPSAGEPFVVVENESRAREIAEFRTRKLRDKAAGVTAGARGTLDEMLARIQAGEQKEVAVLIKADVQGSAEAIQATVLKLAHEEVKVRVLHAAVGQITESDIQLAKASDAYVLAFNVRATVAGARPGDSARASISATTRSSTRWRTTSRSWCRARSRRRRARTSWATPKCARCSTSPAWARSPAAWSPTAW